MKNKKTATVAGILMLVAAAINVTWIVAGFTGSIDFKEIFRFVWIVSPLPYFGVASGFGGNTIVSSLAVVVFIIAVLARILGGVLSLNRKTWQWALIGSVGTIICLPILGVAATIMALISRR